jgi:hypothetical protein
VLVEDRLVDVRPVQDGAAVAHAQGEGGQLVGVQAPEEDRHREGRDLRVAEPAVADARRDHAQLVGRQGLAVALVAQQLLDGTGHPQL